MNQINTLILTRSIVSAGFASVMVASEHYLFELTGKSAGRTKRITSYISTLSSAQSLTVNALSGYLIDVYGRKPVLVVSCILSGFARALPVLYPRVWVYVAYRLLNGAASASIMTAISAMFSDMLGGRSTERYQSTLQLRFLVMAFVRMIVLRVAGRSKNLKYNFIAGSALPVIAGLCFALFTKETRYVCSEENEKNDLVPTCRPSSSTLNPFHFIQYFSRNVSLRCVAMMLAFQYVPMYNLTESVRRKERFDWTLKDSEMMMQVANVCEVLRPWIYKRLAILYGLVVVDAGENENEEEETTDSKWKRLCEPYRKCIIWDFRIRFMTNLIQVLTPIKSALYFTPAMSMLFGISNIPERCLDLIPPQQGGSNVVVGEGAKIAALQNLPVPLGLIMPFLFDTMSVRFGSNTPLMFCALFQLLGSEVLVPYCWRKMMVVK
jgi:MFS family permease